MNSAAIEDQAVRWFVRRESGSLSCEEEALFQSWLEASNAHRIAYLRAEAAWNHAARMKALGAGVPPGVLPLRGSWGDKLFSKGAMPEPHRSPMSVEDSPNVLSTPSKSKFFAFASLILVAAAAVVAANSGFLRGERYSTPVGGLQSVALLDGSRVILNTDSRMRVDMHAKERRIALTKGEAFFDVAKDPARPFVVEASDKRVVAVGTKFSVRRHGDELQVIVTEGKVRLEAAPKDSAAVREAPDTVLLRAGSVARTANREIMVREHAGSVAEKMLSWRSGFVNFDNQTLAEAVAEFNRYNTREIVIEDSSIESLPLSGNFRANNIEAFLWLLQSGFPVAVEEDNGRVVLKAP